MDFSHDLISDVAIPVLRIIIYDPLYFCQLMKQTRCQYLHQTTHK